jgi:hypothetical protein
MNHNLQQSCSSTAWRYSGRPDHPRRSCRELVRSASAWKSVNDKAETAEFRTATNETCSSGRNSHYFDRSLPSNPTHLLAPAVYEWIEPEVSHE